MSAKEERLLLEVVGGTQAPAELPRSGMLAIGSSPDKAGYVLQGQGIADVHCAIGRTKDGGFAIKDLGSEYGTLLNGAKVSQSRVGKGDEILLGSVRLRVVAAEGAASAPAAPKPKPAAKKPARRAASKLPKIQGYKLQQPLGKGAMGDVYLAVQISLDREVALKVLSKKHEADEAFVASFQAEARSAAALNHPNVVTVHDVGEQDGVHYLTMEYMDRGSLEERVAKEGPLPWTIVLEALKDAASGLVYAESRGIVHRDIKPANLMQNHAGATKIADLGLATSIGSEEALEGDRKIFGTPHFISPEQIKGEKADCRSDLYSLGSTAYRLLTGHTPYEGKNTREILRDKLRGEHVPIQERAADVPAGLVVLVNRLMELDPADRYPTASALLREIERLQSGASAAENGAGSGGGMSTGVKIGIGAGVLALGAVAAIFLGGGGEPQNDNPRSSNDPGSNTETANVEPDSPEDLPTIPDISGDGAGTGTTNVVDEDNDIAERLFETAAENAYLKLGQKDLLPGERRDALRELAREYFGTTTATTAIEEAEALDARITADAAAEGQHTSQLTGIFKLLNEAAGLDDPALHPGNSLRAMQAVEGLDAFAADDAFLAQYAELKNSVVSTALGQFNGALQAIGALEQSGDFEGARQSITGLLNRTEMPEFEEGQAPARVDEIAILANSLRQRIDGLGGLEVAFQSDQRKSDRELTGREIGPNSAFLEQLARLDFAAAAQQAAQLNASLQTADSQSWGADFTAQLERAAQAFPILWNNFGDWRRKAAPNPTEKRGGNRDVLRVDASGMLLDISGKQTDVPWSAYGGHTKALHMLFSKRLRRDYTNEETGQIAALMRFAAVGETLLSAGEMFTASTRAVFTESEAEELPLAFDHALAWCTTPAETQAVMREQAASRLLGMALAHGSEGAWTTTVSELEQLYREYPSTWIVRLLSDGTPLTLPE